MLGVKSVVEAFKVVEQAHSGRCVMLNELCLGRGEGEKTTKQTMIDKLIHSTCQHLSLTCLLLAYCYRSVRLQVYIL
jgi:hypothetical protein